MKIKTAAENMPVVSNVGHVGEFRIRNSAKAFSILSSSLYENKIKAIIRELSCNAFDSHVQAGKGDCPFHVHLPNSLEPWFSIRDYGVGLSHDGVVNVFTTYFESTKTDSNDVIGGLGLGCKSPFSYSDNFLITAVKDGRKGVYTAFINEHGVPSIATMHEGDTNEPNGVEIKLTVNNTYDFRKFESEARSVYEFFPVQPVVTGVEDFKPRSTEYQLRDIVPGVHEMSRGQYSRVVMGNIAYPLNVPNSEVNLGSLHTLAHAGLELHFDIGELDIQASREGLSYIPETIAAIRAKLQATSDAMYAKIEVMADAIDDVWERAGFIYNTSNSDIKRAAAVKYNLLKPSPFLTETHYGSLYFKGIDISETLIKSWNIELQAFQYNDWGENSVLSTTQGRGGVRDWKFAPSKMVFIAATKKTNALRRAKHHAKNSGQTSHRTRFYVMTPIDTTVPMNTAEFFKALHMTDSAVDINTLMELPKTVKTAATKAEPRLLRLQKRNPNGYGYRSRDNDLIWREDQLLKDFPSTNTYYYIPMIGMTADMTINAGADDLVRTLRDAELFGIGKAEVYGVLKRDIKEVKKLSNWKNLEDYVVDSMNAVNDKMIEHWAASICSTEMKTAVFETLSKQLNATSPLSKSIASLKNRDKSKFNSHAIQRLLNWYPNRITNTTIIGKVKEKAKLLQEVFNDYPLLRHLDYNTPASYIVDYVELIDKTREKNGEPVT